MISTNQDFSLMQTFGWTPKEIKELDEIDKMIHLAILKGRSLAEKKNA